MKERFEVNNGVIFDNNTGLMWMQNPLDKLFTWDEACKIKHEFGGFNDWRLPTIEELISIIDYSKRNPSIDEVFWFVDKKYFWSSSPYVGSTGLAWYVYFGYGSVDYDYRDNAFPVRLVRNIEDVSINNIIRSRALGVRLVKEIENLNEEGFPKQILDLFERLKKFI